MLIPASSWVGGGRTASPLAPASIFVQLDGFGKVSLGFLPIMGKPTRAPRGASRIRAAFHVVFYLSTRRACRCFAGRR
jgi:hypothetical protein